ncbi:hypothetical protein BHE74_00052284, partial [Ensete ventricosum]
MMQFEQTINCSPHETITMESQTQRHTEPNKRKRLRFDGEGRKKRHAVANTPDTRVQTATLHDGSIALLSPVSQPSCFADEYVSEEEDDATEREREKGPPAMGDRWWGRDEGWRQAMV